MAKEYTPYQRKVIQRYYEHRDTIQTQKLAELVTDLYLAEGAKRKGVWKRAAAAMEKLGVPAARIAHIVATDDPALVAQVVKELDAQS